MELTQARFERIAHVFIALTDPKTSDTGRKSTTPTVHRESLR